MIGDIRIRVEITNAEAVARVCANLEVIERETEDLVWKPELAAAVAALRRDLREHLGAKR